MKILHEIYRYYVPQYNDGTGEIYTFVVLSNNKVYLIYMGILISRYNFARFYEQKDHALYIGSRISGIRGKIGERFAMEAYEYGEQWCNENKETQKL